MKRLIILGTMLLLSACCETNKEKVDFPVRARSYTYEGHQYIMFLYNQYINGVVHDPDCPCHKNRTTQNHEDIY